MGQGSGVTMSCVVGHRCSWDFALLWPWHTPAAVALIQPLAWECQYAASAALLKKKKKKDFKLLKFTETYFVFPDMICF